MARITNLRSTKSDQKKENSYSNRHALALLSKSRLSISLCWLELYNIQWSELKDLTQSILGNIRIDE